MDVLPSAFGSSVPLPLPSSSAVVISDLIDIRDLTIAPMTVGPDGLTVTFYELNVSPFHRTFSLLLTVYSYDHISWPDRSLCKGLNSETQCGFPESGT